MLITTLITILVFFVILTVLVLIHEAGHFFVAKFFKIKVEEFGFGLPPRLFGIKRGETIYSINWLPIGGFVKLYGEDEAGSGSVKVKTQDVNKKDIDRAFFSKPVWQRATVVVAGVVMNAVLAVGIVSFLFSYVGVPTPGGVVTVENVIKGAPAESVGIKAGDIVEEINGAKLTSTEQLITTTKKNLGKEMMLKIKTPKGEQTVALIPRKDYPKDQGPLGVSISENIKIKKYPWYEAPIAGTREVLNQSGLILVGLGTVVYQLVTTGSVPQDVAGPVGIAQLTGKVVDIGPYAVLSFVALLSLNLAIINILPIPALDGGRLFFILIEGVTRKKVNPRFEGYAHTIGMVLLLLLIALITIHDLFKLVTGQPILPQFK